MSRPEATTQRVLSYADLKTRGIRFSRQWIVKLIASGRFPKPIKLGQASVGFLEHEINGWIDDRISERDSADA
jgi:prophage regulatory protein